MALALAAEKTEVLVPVAAETPAAANSDLAAAGYPVENQGMMILIRLMCHRQNLNHLFMQVRRKKD